MIGYNDNVSREDDFDIKAAVAEMQEYWLSYDKQHGWEGYDEITFLNDALYGIARATGEKYRFANGFRKWMVTKLYAAVVALTKDDFEEALKGRKYK